MYKLADGVDAPLHAYKKRSFPRSSQQDLQQQQQQQGHTTSAAQRRIHHTARTDTSDARDQLSLSLGYSPDLAKAARREPSADDQAARLEELSRLPSIKFVYSAQVRALLLWGVVPP